MEFIIFNVSHGFCAALKIGNHLTLIDCGHDDNHDFTPIEWLYQKGFRQIDTLIISNFDQDHVSDIITLRDKFRVGKFVANRTINSLDLTILKLESGPLTPQMCTAITGFNQEALKAYSLSEVQPPGSQFEFYFVVYPHETDTNNLSLVTVVSYKRMRLIYPGDLEKRGWQKLLELEEFRRTLTGVNIFIASHHGRVNGYCEEIFEYCEPEIVIISDQSRVYGTQEHDYYSKHVKGNGLNYGTVLNPKFRKVLTTRNDGDISIFEKDEKILVRPAKG
ncbi:MAG: hypothetical protein JAZ20_06515 [Candidatus Thiodiazotropha weberae]|nr:hypothetical protein [Candidatus Thiodiazotropha lotti]MCG8013489.1 hypothetical protein [Candidatus Thiodiazotropha lotti]MCG8020053.1 hypothetical protein [Candidatus Thiodiazotropha lotti]MCW4207215.1 hypothetical protein [Candidatus Thiodiazotropha lotti]MCW4212965.1 hypothetical protein [Candidatus Thiodiazotropha lotti]